jgi:hypothetical protein
MKRNQYSENTRIYGEKIQDNCHKKKQESEKCNITMDDRGSILSRGKVFFL